MSPQHLPPLFESLPDEWATERVDDAFAIQQGKQVSKNNRKGDNQRPFLRTRNVFWGRLDLDDLDEMHFTETDEERLALKDGDLLLCEGGAVGRTAIWKCEHSRCYYQNHLHRLRSLNGNMIPSFALYWFWYAFEYGGVYFGRDNVTTIPNMSKSRLGELPIPRPDVNEQRRIAAVLSLVQRAIEQQERLIALTRELKRALMHKLFTEGTRGEPQKQTEIGPVPESWKETTLGELCKKPDGRIQTGPFGSILHKNEYQDRGTPIVNPVHLIDNRVSHDGVPRISGSALDRLHRYRLHAGDLLFARRGEIGRHALVTDDEDGWFCGTGCFIVRPAAVSPDVRYLNAFFSHPPVVHWLEKHATGVIMANLSNKVLERVPVYLPPISEQKLIAEAVESLDDKVGSHRRTRATLRDLFRTLLHQLMTAQIRVNDVDLSELEVIGTNELQEVA